MFADEPIVYVNDNVEYGKSKVLFFLPGQLVKYRGAILQLII